MGMGYKTASCPPCVTHTLGPASQLHLQFELSATRACSCCLALMGSAAYPALPNIILFLWAAAELHCSPGAPVALPEQASDAARAAGEGHQGI